MEKKPESYYGGTRPEMLAFVPADAGSVLEVGCAAGGFGAQLKVRGVREVWGVEVVEAAGAKARNVLDRVLVGDIAAVIDELPRAYFDVILFNDVLEHLVDPWQVLARIKVALKPGGIVVSSIPNMRYYHVLREFILHKRWEYEEQGILDRTHLRFFTTNSIRNMYADLGYEILRHEGINPMPKAPWSYRIGNFLLRGKIRDMQFEQFVTWARPASIPETPST